MRARSRVTLEYTGRKVPGYPEHAKHLVHASLSRDRYLRIACSAEVRVRVIDAHLGDTCAGRQSYAKLSSFAHDRKYQNGAHGTSRYKKV